MENNKEMYLRWLKRAEASGDVEMILYCDKKLEECEGKGMASVKCIKKCGIPQTIIIDSGESKEIADLKTVLKGQPKIIDRIYRDMTLQKKLESHYEQEQFQQLIPNCFAKIEKDFHQEFQFLQQQTHQG